MNIRAYFQYALLMVKINAQYKFNLVCSALFPYVNAGTMLIFLGTAISSGETVHGYSRTSLLSYYLLAALMQNAVIPSVKYDVFYEIRSGNFDVWAVRPISFTVRTVFGGISASLYKLFFSFLAMAPILFFVGHYFGPIGLALSVWGILAMFLAIVLCSVLSTLCSMSAFWLENADGMAWLLYFGSMLVSGQVLPLSFFPHQLQVLFGVTPFGLLFAAPVDLIVGNAQNGPFVIIKQLCWIALLMLLVLPCLHASGMRRYESAGG